MLKKIFGTAGAKLVHAFLSLIIVLLNANILGSEGVGTIALIVIGITIILLINNFIGGSALVYLIPKNDLFSVVTISYIWAFISSFGVSAILYTFDLIPKEYFLHILALALINSIGQINLIVLLAKENIKTHNYITVAQIIVIFASILISFYIIEVKTVEAYIFALYCGYGVTLIASSLIVFKKIKIGQLKAVKKLTLQILKYGAYTQFASLAQLLNYRLSYYIIESFFGKSPVGVFDVGIKLSEGLWLPAKSIAMVQYAKIANTKDEEKSIKLSLNFFKFVLVSTSALLILLNIIPEKIYELIKPEFIPVKTVILYLSPGILFLALTMILTHHFSGTGRHYFNTISSLLGLIVTVVAGFILIPQMGLIGGAITASASYFATFLFQLISFIFVTKINYKDFLVNLEDLKLLRTEFFKTIKKNR